MNASDNEPREQVRLKGGMEVKPGDRFPWSGVIREVAGEPKLVIAGGIEQVRVPVVPLPALPNRYFYLMPSEEITVSRKKAPRDDS